MDDTVKDKVDVYSKYKVTAAIWRLEGKGVWRFKGNGLDSESVELGEYMQYALVKGGGDSVDSSVIDSVLHFKERVLLCEYCIHYPKDTCYPVYQSYSLFPFGYKRNDC